MTEENWKSLKNVINDIPNEEIRH